MPTRVRLGVVNAANQNVPRCAWPGPSSQSNAIRALPIRVVNPGTGQAASVELSNIAEVEARLPDPPDVKVHAENGKQGIAIGISMAKGGDIIALGKGLQKQVAEVRKQLPVGMELTQVQGPQAVTRSVGEFVSTLILAIVIVLLVSLVSLGLHFNPIRIDIWPGLVVAIAVRWCSRSPGHDVLGIALPQDLARLADHRAWPARRRRDHRRRVVGAQAGRGLLAGTRRHLRSTR